MALELNTNKRSQGGFAITVIACAVLHLALAPHVEVLGGRFNFMLVLTAALAISGDSRALVYIGFFSGLFYDLTTTGPIGLMALLLAVTGYAVALMSRGLSSGLGMETVRVVVVAIFVVNILHAALLFLLGVQTDLLNSVVGHGLSSSCMDVVASIPLLVLGGSGAAGARGLSRRGGGYGRGLTYGGPRRGGLR